MAEKYAVIGCPIGHSMSPFIHKSLFSLKNIDAHYKAIEIKKQDLSITYHTLLKGLSGYNVTMPHKESIIALLDRLDERAMLYGSVNTIKNGETSEGYTTDSDGFLLALKSADISLGGRVVILGTGGAARVFAFEAVKAGAETMIVYRDGSQSKAQRLVSDIKRNFPFAEIFDLHLSRSFGSADLLINATPCGMFPNICEMPVDSRAVADCAAVFDAVYNPLQTKLIEAARSSGSAVCGGMPMLVWQAAAAHTIWDGSVYTVSEVNSICEEASRHQLGFK